MPTPTPLPGTLWAWGSDSNGQLGVGDKPPRQNRLVTKPTQESTEATGWTAVAAGGNHTVAIKSDGTLWSWGSNSHGQLNIPGSPSHKGIPTLSGGGETDWVAVAAGDNHTVAIKSDGTLWSWGSNSHGQLGDGSIIDKTNEAKQESSGATDWVGVAAGGDHTVALKSDGTLGGWGLNSHGQLGDGTTNDTNNPKQESTGATNWTDISVGYIHTVALKSDGTMWGWGDNGWGSLCQSPLNDSDNTYPKQESTEANDWSDIAAGANHTVAIKSDGTLWSCGNNGSGELGIGDQYNLKTGKFDLHYTTMHRSIPMQESTGATNWTAIAAGGHHAVALKTDGTLWAWGYNKRGQMGDGKTNNRNTPTQESTESTNWTAVAAGPYFTVGLK